MPQHPQPSPGPSPAPPIPASQTLSAPTWRDSAWRHGERTVPEETPIALTYNRLSHAVMMATPADLHDFAVGFSLAEGIIETPADIQEFETISAPLGVELRLWISPGHLTALETRRRRLAGATGCGMCGLESLEAAMRPVPTVPAGQRYTAAHIMAATASLQAAQTLGRETRAVHAAGFWTPQAALVALREDVGRHNALDKLSGALALRGTEAAIGILVLTSRISIELVQKAARMGAPVLVAVSAPTALAVRVAEQAGMTLVGVSRNDGFEVFCREERIK